MEQHMARTSKLFGYWRRRRENRVFEEARGLAVLRLEQYFADRGTRALPSILATLSREQGRHIQAQNVPVVFSDVPY
jgi:hypothetical protein